MEAFWKSKKGVLFQVNSGSLAGMFGVDVQDFAERMVNLGVCDFIGSDAHDVRRRNTDISFCLDNSPYGLNEEALDKALFVNPQYIIKDKQIRVNRLGYFAEI